MRTVAVESAAIPRAFFDRTQFVALVVALPSAAMARSVTLDIVESSIVATLDLRTSKLKAARSTLTSLSIAAGGTAPRALSTRIAAKAMLVRLVLTTVSSPGVVVEVCTTSMPLFVKPQIEQFSTRRVLRARKRIPLMPVPAPLIGLFVCHYNEGSQAPLGRAPAGIETPAVLVRTSQAWNAEGRLSEWMDSYPL